MELRKFIKLFTWHELDRERVVLGPDTRLNPETNRAQLGTYGEEDYPTADNLYVKSWVANPRAVRQWQGFEATVIHKRAGNDNAIKTSAAFRLSDGTSEYWWNGGAWVVSTASWNTEAEVAANISEFPATERKLQVVVNLKTTDPSVTPELVEVKVLYGALLDSEIEDMVERSLMPALRALRPITRVTLAKAGSDTSIELNTYKLDTDYRVVDVDAVFNHTDDPEHVVDLYESHTTRSTPSDPWTDGTVDVITLNALVAAGKTVWLRLRYEPVVAVATSRDWYELEHVPALIIESVTYRGNKLGGEDHVGNKSDGSAWVIPAPRQGRLELTLRGVADKLIDAERLNHAVLGFFGDHPSLRSTGLDEPYRLWLVSEQEFRGRPNAEDVHEWRKTFRIENFRVWDQGAEPGYLVQRFLVRGSLDVVVE
jgi:hypothetical protein